MIPARLDATELACLTRALVNKTRFKGPTFSCSPMIDSRRVVFFVRATERGWSLFKISILLVCNVQNGWHALNKSAHTINLQISPGSFSTPRCASRVDGPSCGAPRCSTLVCQCRRSTGGSWPESRPPSRRRHSVAPPTAPLGPSGPARRASSLGRPSDTENCQFSLKNLESIKKITGTKMNQRESLRCAFIFFYGISSRKLV